ncbi:ALDH3A2 [Cordylochernes scorpioides]|uniref:ALDH3A2 n=1 Tax=Cordylochernes scorpioides TaxID=51811 RepID=A0ABY6LW17_9ARAC|nr:ALDH3A2 [Cordylochernes scorpioides]
MEPITMEHILSSRPKQECILVEVEYVLNDIRMMLYNIDEWAKPTAVQKNMVLILDDPYIISEPYGVVLVLGPWNYPLQLALAPFVGAITAGNTVVLKPSELSPATSGLLANLIPKYLDQDCYHVFPGGAEEAQALLKLKFDYIFYTGSTTVGKLVYEAATKHLTPVTLELGGNPTYIADDANLEVTAKRMMWGKMLNAGQTCIAPDYILTSAATRDRLVAVIADTLKSFYGDIDPINSPDFGRIVSNKHVA